MHGPHGEAEFDAAFMGHGDQCVEREAGDRIVELGLLEFLGCIEIGAGVDEVGHLVGRVVADAIDERTKGDGLAAMQHSQQTRVAGLDAGADDRDQ